MRLSCLYRHAANAHQSEDRFQEALDLLDRGVAAMDRVVRSEPNYLDHGVHRYTMHLNRAVILQRFGRRAESLRDWDAIVRLAESEPADPSQADWARVERVNCHLVFNDVPTAVREARQLLGRNDFPANHLLTLAFTFGDAHARTAEGKQSPPPARDELVNDGVQCLRGFFASGKALSAAKLHELRPTPQFQTLRAHPAFQKLLGEVDRALRSRAG
ncbi:MAG: hypothetical protein ACRC33_20475 [Gemmataceae bacterium]